LVPYWKSVATSILEDTLIELRVTALFDFDIVKYGYLGTGSNCTSTVLMVSRIWLVLSYYQAPSILSYIIIF